MSKSRKSVLVILSILTVAASITKILIGLDFDENYIIVLRARLLQRDHLFRECWDLYQTTGFTMALVLGIFKGITGGYEGAILFCRIVTAILQLLLGMVTWYSLRKYFRNADFAGLVVANMLPRGTLNLEYGFLSCNYILISMLLLFLVSREEKNWSKVKVYVLLILSGILFSIGILCYPTMIIATIVLIAYFFSIRENRRKGLFIDPEEKSSYLIRKDDIDENLTEKDTVLILSQDPVYNIYAPYRFSSATALTTPVYGNQWVEYYKRNHVQPTVVLIDKEYLDVNALLNQTAFGMYLKEEYDESSLYEAEGFWILRR